MLVAETVPRETVALELGSVIKKGASLGRVRGSVPSRPGAGKKTTGRVLQCGCGGEKKRRNGQEEKPRAWLGLGWTMADRRRRGQTNQSMDDAHRLQR